MEDNVWIPCRKGRNCRGKCSGIEGGSVPLVGIPTGKDDGGHGWVDVLLLLYLQPAGTSLNLPVPWADWMTEAQRQNPSEQMAYQTVFVRMAGLLILLMTVGRWVDIVNVFISLVGELWCLARVGVLLGICRKQVSVGGMCDDQETIRRERAPLWETNWNFSVAPGGL